MGDASTDTGDDDTGGASFASFAAGFVEADGGAEGSRRGAKGGSVEPVMIRGGRVALTPVLWKTGAGPHLYGRMVCTIR